MSSEPGPAHNVRSLPASPGGGVASYDRVPPHNLDAEVSVLGSMLLSKDAIAEASELIGPEDFYRGAHRTMFEAMHDLYDRGEPVDPITLADELAAKGKLEDVGGAVAIADLVARVPTAANALYYSRIVADQATRRRVIDTGTNIARMGYDTTQGIDEVVDSSERLVYDVSQRKRVSEFTPMKQLLAQSFEQIEKLHENNSAITGLETGFIDFDELTAGLQPQNLVILAARPAMGKCLSGDARVLDAKTGAYRRIADLVATGESPLVVAMDGRYRLGATPTSHVHDNGIRQVYRITTRLGRQLTATANHPFRTVLGWRELAELQPGDCIAAPCELPHFGGDALPEAEVSRLAAAAAGGALADIPEVVFRLPKDQLALFLHRLVATGGRVDTSRRSPRLLYTGPSRRHVADVAHLLLRFGVVAGQRPLPRGRATTGRPVAAPASEGIGRDQRAWMLEVADLRSLQRLQREVGADGGVLEQALAAVPDTDWSTDCEPLPRAVWQRLSAARAGRSWASISAALGRSRNHNWHAGTRAPSRRVVAELARELADDDLAALAHGDVLWDEIVAVEPAGRERVYDLTVPGEHNFVAEDLVAHNSTLVVNIATHVAVEKREPVVLFSLEMSQMELVQRVLAGQARVDSERLRTGRLQESDWPKLSQAMGRLAEAPLYIDDTPGINLMEIRSKARRLKQQKGLSLLIVDYLQLMQSHRRVENRVQEVSELSRGLKVLAKELDIPVVALSQLSRRPEERTDRRPQLADLRESGCLTGDARVLRADTGAEVTMRELHDSGERDIPVWTLGHDYTMTRGTMSHVFPTGVKPVFELQLASGRRLTASANHPFLTIDGWRRLDELHVDSRIAVPRRTGQPDAAAVWSEHEVILLAHLLGNGRDGVDTGVSYHSADVDSVRVVEEAARGLGIGTRRVRRGPAWRVDLQDPPREPSHAEGPVVGRPVLAWPEGTGVFGRSPSERFVPAEVFNLKDPQVALFLSHLWAAGGSLQVDDDRRVTCTYTTASRRMADDVQQLLTRLGVRSRLRDAGDRLADGCRLCIEDAASQLRFAEEIGVHGPHGGAATAVREHLRGQPDSAQGSWIPGRVQDGVDTIPAEVWDQVEAARRARGANPADLEQRLPFSYADAAGREVTRADLGTIAGALGEAHLGRLARSDVHWDRVVGICPRGREEVFDATVAGTHNFVANGIIVENSIEQDADIVLFIYRDEVYDPDSAARGEAELIVSKHRNGPLKTVRLSFIGHHSRFASMAKGHGAAPPPGAPL